MTQKLKELMFLFSKYQFQKTLRLWGRSRSNWEN